VTLINSIETSCGIYIVSTRIFCLGDEIADMWYDEIKKYNFNKPGFSSGTGILKK